MQTDWGGQSVYIVCNHHPDQFLRDWGQSVNVLLLPTMADWGQSACTEFFMEYDLCVFWNKYSVIPWEICCVFWSLIN